MKDTRRRVRYIVSAERGLLCGGGHSGILGGNLSAVLG